MDIRKKIIKIASNILADINFSNQKEFEEYLKNHPNYREDTKFFVDGMQVSAPPREKNRGEDEKIQMTDEQKFLHQKAMSENLRDNRFAAVNKNSHPKTLEALSKHKHTLIRDGVAGNPSTPVDTLKKLFHDEQSIVRESAATNPKFPTQILDEQIEKSNYINSDYYAKLANIQTLHPKSLDKLSKSRNSKVRQGVASNRNTSDETFRRLSHDSDWFVIMNIAKNKKTPKDVLEYFIDNRADAFGGKILRETVSENLKSRKQN